MTAMASEREAFEKWYVENAFDYESNPLTSRECGLSWKAWQARAHLSQPAQAVDVEGIVGRLDGNIRHVLSEVSRGGDQALLQDLATHALLHLDGVQDEIRHALTAIPDVTASDFATAMRDCGMSLHTFSKVNQRARQIAKERTAALTPKDSR